MPVITPDGVVGRLKDVFPHTAQVLVINDQTSGAGVLLQTTRLRGVLRGNVFGQPQIINILPDERIKQGEPVVTSGGDQIFPRGLPVGTVEKVVEDPEHDPYVDVIIKPAANLAHLEEVLVITQMSDQMPPEAQRDIAKSEAAAEVDADKQRASDILAQKLPGYTDPDAPADDADQGPVQTANGEIGRPITPLKAIHPDKYSPDAAPPASSLTPGAVVPHSVVSGNAISNGDSSTSKPKTRTPTDAVPDGGNSAAPATPVAPKPRKPKPVTPPAEEQPSIQQAPPATPQAALHPDLNSSGGRG
jgi:rod shape-determining protein MreC